MDSVHVRHLVLLLDTALLALVYLFLAVEVAGVLPTQVRRFVFFLIRKPVGGRRPVMLAPAFYRWWKRKPKYGKHSFPAATSRRLPAERR